MKIVKELCVMGGTRMIDNLMENKKKYTMFKKQISLTNLLSINPNQREKYIAKILKDFKATRFYNQQAEKIVEFLKNSNIIARGHVVLLKGLSHKQPAEYIRNELMRRNTYFKLKSASDFMIEVGLSHDVIAFDTRIVNILKKHFDLNVSVDKVQGNKDIYESIEDALRQSCGVLDISLAQLDRLLFRFNNKNVITFILEYL